MAAVPQSSSHAAKHELRCAVCGYGVIVEQPPPAYPICRSTAWHQISARPRAPRAI
jgi:rubredoxin